MKTHGESGTRLHNIWAGMVSRCRDRGNSIFSYYGGRGISVCPEWFVSYVVFRDWALTHGYYTDLELDRKDNNGNYTPDNCQWVSESRNCRNRRSNILVSAFGENKIIIEWWEDPRCSVDYQTLRQRIQKYGWDAERAISTPLTQCIKGQRVVKNRNEGEAA